MTTETQSFSFFPATSCICNIWSVAIDTGSPAVHSDTLAEEACCNECSCICIPCTFIFDLLSCPFRGTYFGTKHICSKCSTYSTYSTSPSSSYDTQKNVINTQP